MLLAFALLFGSQAQGRVFFITDTNDTLRINSLRGAIIAANGIRGHNTILLRRGTYQLTIPGAIQSQGQAGALDITQGELEIRGIDSYVIITAAGLGNRAFHVWLGANVIFENLTLSGGRKLYPDQPDGGGVFNEGALTLKNCAVSGNCIIDDFGGGIYNTAKLTLTGCIVSRNSTGIGPGNGGAGIYNSNTGTLEMDSCEITNNTCGNDNAFGIFIFSLGGSGGGVYNAGSATLNNCAVNGNICGAGSDVVLVGSGGDIYNDTGGSGGGIYNSGELTMKNCSINGNLAGSGGYNAGKGGDGGGICSTGSFILDSCTIAGNSAGLGGGGSDGGQGGNGGGIYNSGTFSLTCCTIGGNSAGSGEPGGINGTVTGNGGMGGNGGGIYNDTTGSFLLSSCTIALNGAGSGGAGYSNGPVARNGGMGGSGGGIFNTATDLSAGMRNTLIALNLVGAGGAGGTAVTLSPGIPGLPGSSPDLSGAFTSEGFNLVGEADGSIGLTNGVDADQVGTTATPIDPLIGPLQMNGGPTSTHALLWGSPAIDQGNSFGIHTDQRGHHRLMTTPPFLMRRVATAVISAHSNWIVPWRNFMSCQAQTNDLFLESQSSRATRKRRRGRPCRRSP